MVKCPECDQQVASGAAACPHCGQRLAKKHSILTYLFLIVVILIGLAALFETAFL